MTVREEQLREELAEVNAHLESLADLGDGGFAQALVHGQMRRRRDELQAALEACISRTIEMSFVDADRPDGESLSADVLSTILGRLQSALTFATWANISGPGVQGRPPAAVERDARAEVVATPAGSFGLVLRKQAHAMSQYFEQSAADVLSLVAGAGAGDFGQLEPIAARLGREATRRLELLFRRLGEEHIDTSITWHTPAGSRSAFITSASAMALGDWLAAATPDIEVRNLRARLRRADSLSGAFKLEVEGTGEMLEGSGDSELLTGRTLDADYDAMIEVTTQIAAHTGRKTTRYRLLALSD